MAPSDRKSNAGHCRSLIGGVIMFTIIVQTMQQIFQILIHDWDTLVKKVGKSTANVLLTYIAMVVLFEVIWLTLVISILVLVVVLN